MQRATITFEDNDDGSVSLTVDFDPEVDLTEPVTSPSIVLLYRAIERINETIGDWYGGDYVH